MERLVNRGLNTFQPRYLTLFEERLRNLRPYEIPFKPTERINLGVYHPEKLTTAVVTYSRDMREWNIFLPHHTKSGYYQGDHYDLDTEVKEVFHEDVQHSKNGIFFVADHKRYLVLLEEKSSFLHLPNIFSDSQKYDIHKVFCIPDMVRMEKSGYHLEYDGVESIDISEMLFRDWSSQIGELYGMTVTEGLRFWLTGIMPDGKKPNRRGT